MDNLTEQELKDFVANPVFNRFLLEMRHRTVREWVAAETTEERDEIWHIRKALETLPTWINNKLAARPEKKLRGEY